MESAAENAAARDWRHGASVRSMHAEQALKDQHTDEVAAAVAATRAACEAEFHSSQREHQAVSGVAGSRCQMRACAARVKFRRAQAIAAAHRGDDDTVRDAVAQWQLRTNQRNVATMTRRRRRQLTDHAWSVWHSVVFSVGSRRRAATTRRQLVHQRLGRAVRWLCAGQLGRAFVRWRAEQHRAAVGVLCVFVVLHVMHTTASGSARLIRSLAMPQPHDPSGLHPIVCIGAPRSDAAPASGERGGRRQGSR